MQVQDEVTMLRAKLMQLGASGGGSGSSSTHHPSQAVLSPVLQQLNAAMMQAELSIGVRSKSNTSR